MRFENREHQAAQYIIEDIAAQVEFEKNRIDQLKK